MNRRSFLMALGGASLPPEPCSQKEVNQALREIESLKLSPPQRNREWNILVQRYSIFSCLLMTVNLELKKIERQPEVISLGVKRAVAESEHALKAMVKAFGNLKGLV